MGKSRKPPSSSPPGAKQAQPEDVPSQSVPITTKQGRLLRLSEVLERVGHKKSWVYAKIAAGEFPPGLVIGRRRFWYESEVHEALFQLLKKKDPGPVGRK